MMELPKEIRDKLRAWAKRLLGEYGWMEIAPVWARRIKALGKEDLP